MNKFFMLVSLSAAIAFTSCKSTIKETEHLGQFKVTSPLLIDTSLVEDYVCQIHSIQHIELRAQERGYLEKIYVDEGQHVKEGQLLFQIMPRLYEAELQSAEAEADFARIEYENTKRLADSNIVAPNELAMARAKLKKAEAELALARVHLQFTEIRAPFDGIIDKFHVRLGSLIEEGDLLTHLSDNSQLWVYYNVPEAQYLEYVTHLKSDSKMKVQLRLANNAIFDQIGVVETIEADFNNETGNIPFRATFKNPNGILRHGETGNILMKIDLENAMIIPQKATFEILDKKYVYVINKEHKVEMRPITITAEIPDLYAVEGLKEDDIILLEGLRKVRNNEHIEYSFQEPSTVISGLRLHAE
ncbi:efflux RND transporter periplasmic adaptor subunit [bacterium]|nr:efflux RND transporter periplasmic adaptor subunit [bacterium]